ncbi:Rhodopsin kinase GRK1 [Dissostichus eleginoides]|uniref:Rhodopsin kinase GRK1 n=1 Tax=Dissostichus eleginoides TaxID=100907 RepID=A0AAD9BY69_DISEL|nr:Rhodopsin kinase GRK1 [Dissostichus eleginoides]
MSYLLFTIYKANEKVTFVSLTLDWLWSLGHYQFKFKSYVGTSGVMASELLRGEYDFCSEYSVDYSTLRVQSV